MITKLTLENFEGHKKTEFDFHPGLNVFVGESDRGKSSVLRAFGLLTQNKPGGEWMRPLFWEGTTTITGEFTNTDKSKFIIKRTRGKSENTYQLNDDAPVNAGSSVPVNIAKLIDIDSVNIQTQIDRAFLMFESAGERGRILNRISGLDEIDTTLDKAKRDCSKLKKAWESEKAFSKVEKEKLEELPDIESMEIAIREIENKEKRLSLSKNKIVILVGSINKLKTVEEDLLHGEKLIQAQIPLDVLSVKISAIVEVKRRVERLKTISGSLYSVEKGVNKDDFVGAEKKLNELMTKNNELMTLDKKIDKIDQILERLSIIDQDTKIAEDDLKKHQSKIPNICTECGAKL